MLTEQFVASIAAPTKPNTGITKDAGIFLHEYQPLAAQRHVFKKSASNPNGLAVSPSHIFAAQADKAVVHVYSREKGNQEAIIPFPERIHSVALACNDTVLLLGAESGRIMAWEICSGRLVSTSTSHLQPVTAIAVDAASHYFLSGSSDAMIHVWNLPQILSFSPDASRSPVHTLSTHRGPITGLACGHSATTANIAVSVSEDKSALVWDYHSGQALRTYLLPDVPAAVALDPADRALYVAYGDGSLQTISFYDDMQRSTPVDVLRSGSQSHIPIQPSPKTRFSAESQKLGGARSLGLSWDGTILVSGHESGKIAAWDIAKGNYLSILASLSGPVTNIQFLNPTGFSDASEAKYKIHTVTKPKQDLNLPTSGNALVPPNYNLSIQFTGRVEEPSVSAANSAKSSKSAFDSALTHPSFPLAMLEESLAELETWGAQPSTTVAPAADFLSLSATDTDMPDQSTARPVVAQSTGGREDEVQSLKKQVASLQRIQKVTFKQLAELREEKAWFVEQEKKRAAGAKKTAKQKPVNGDVEMSDGGSSEEEEEEEDEDEDEDESEEDDEEESEDEDEE